MSDPRSQASRTAPKQRGQDLLGLTLAPLGAYAAAAIVLTLRGGAPRSGAALLYAPVTGLTALVGAWPGLLLAVAVTALGVRVFFSRRPVPVGRHLLGCVAATLGVALAAGAASAGAGGEFGSALPEALPGTMGRIGSVALGLIVFLTSIWVAWLGPAGGPSQASGTRLDIPADPTRRSEGVSAAEAAALVTELAADAPAAPAARRTSTRAEIPAGTHPLGASHDRKKAQEEPRPLPGDARPIPTGAQALAPAEPAREDLAAGEPGAPEGAVGARTAEGRGTPAFPRLEVRPLEMPGGGTGPAAGERFVPAWEREDDHAEALGEAVPLGTALPEEAVPEDEAEPEELRDDEEEELLGLEEASDAELPELEEEDEEDEEELEDDEAGTGEALASWEVDETEVIEEPEEEPELVQTAAPPPAGSMAWEQAGLFDGAREAAELPFDETEDAVATVVPAKEHEEDEDEEQELVEATSDDLDDETEYEEDDDEEEDDVADDEELVAEEEPEEVSLSVADEEAAEDLDGELEEEPSDEEAAEEPAAAEAEYVLEPRPPRGPSAPDDDDFARVVHEAGCLVLEEQRVAVSMIERRFGLEFDAACRVLDELQDQGLIGPYIGGRTRAILLDREEWLARSPAG